MREYELGDDIFIDINDIRTKYKTTYCKSIRSNTQLLERKSITDYIYGRIIDNQLARTEKLSKKYGSIFINKNALAELFDTPIEEVLPAVPPLIEDPDLVFFRDDDGREYKIPIHGKRTKELIFFPVKDIMRLFQMKNLSSSIQLDHTQYQEEAHYVFFNTTTTYKVHNHTTKEMYLTYSGLMKVIHTSRSGIGCKFKDWIDEVVFNSLWGSQEQKIGTFKRVLSVDADHLKAIMDKSAINISCLYLIDLGISDTNKRVFKYGFTDNIHRRFKQHIKRYGDSIKLDTFILIPNLDLSKAEAEFKNSISRHRYHRDSDNELISLCNEAYLNMRNVFKTISEKYCGNMRNQIAQYESEIIQLKHSYEMKMAKLESINNLQQKDIEILHSKLELRDRDIEILKLKLQLAQASG